MKTAKGRLRGLVWESLPVNRRCEEEGVQYAITQMAEGARHDDLKGLTEAELLALLAPAVRDVVIAELNGEASPQAGDRRVSRQGPGPKKSRPRPRVRKTGTR